MAFYFSTAHNSQLFFSQLMVLFSRLTIHNCFLHGHNSTKHLLSGQPPLAARGRQIGGLQATRRVERTTYLGDDKDKTYHKLNYFLEHELESYMKLIHGAEMWWESHRDLSLMWMATPRAFTNKVYWTEWPKFSYFVMKSYAYNVIFKIFKPSSIIYINRLLKF